jgi:hypothetical protein
MPEPDIGRELRDAPTEPLLPIEKKLVAAASESGSFFLRCSS